MGPGQSASEELVQYSVGRREATGQSGSSELNCPQWAEEEGITRAGMDTQ